MLRLIEPDSGQLRFEGRDLRAFDADQLRAFRRDAQIIFQDPYASLNPRMTVSQILSEPLSLHGLVPAAQRPERVAELLRLVGLEPRFARRYPHEFSGGQRQRIAIARALAVEPKLVICDEPVSALDVSIRSQILNLLRDLQDRLGLAYIFVSHDLAVVKHIADRIAVMNLGCIVETGPTQALFAAPAPSLYPRLAVGDPGAQAAGKAQPHPVAGRDAERAPSAAGLPLSHPLPLRRRSLPHRDPRTRGRCGRPCHRLPPHRGAAAGGRRRRPRWRPVADAGKTGRRVRREPEGAAAAGVGTDSAGAVEALEGDDAMKIFRMALAAAACDARRWPPARRPRPRFASGLRKIPTFSIRRMARTYVGRIVFAAVCDKLFDIDEKLNIVPQLALSQETSADGKEVTIKLRPGVKFHDGEAVRCGGREILARAPPDLAGLVPQIGTRRRRSRRGRSIPSPSSWC